MYSKMTAATLLIIAGTTGNAATLGIDDKNSIADYRNVMIDNGNIMNEAVSLSSGLTDVAPQDAGLFSASVNFDAVVDDQFDEVAAVPLPAGLPLVLSGLAVFGFVRARRRKS